MKIVPNRFSNSLNFVGRSARNNSVVASVASIDGAAVFPAGSITVALGGAVLASRLQPKDFYTAQNVAVLKPLKEMSIAELIFYCKAIEHNKFRYGTFGREANRTLRTLLVPTLESIPSWVRSTRLPDIGHYRDASITPVEHMVLDTSQWHTFKYEDLFDIKKGKRLTKQNMKPGKTPFVGSSDSKNGITAHIAQEPIHQGNTISVCYNGSVGEAFYQPEAFWASDDVNVLYPHFELTPARALFLTTLIKKEKFKYNYGRKWHLARMKKSQIKLPVNKDHNLDLEYIDRFMLSLPYSSAI
jgi:hypothetical protein